MHQVVAEPRQHGGCKQEHVIPEILTRQQPAMQARPLDRHAITRKRVVYHRLLALFSCTSGTSRGTRAATLAAHGRTVSRERPGCNRQTRMRVYAPKPSSARAAMSS